MTLSVRLPALAVLLVSGFAPQALAAPVTNDNTGTWVDDYRDNQGVANAIPQTFGVTYDFVGQLMTLQPTLDPPVGQYATTVIAPASFSEWNYVYLKYASPTPVMIEVMDNDTQQIYGPFSVGASDDPAWDGRADISSVPATVVNARVIVKLQGLVVDDGDGGTTTLRPTVQALRVNWTPRSILKVQIEGGEHDLCAGGTYTFNVLASVSFVDADDLIVFLPVNTVLSPGPFAQNDDLTFGGGTENAQFHAGPGDLVIGTTTIPAGSLYWELGDRPAGNTFTFKGGVRAPVGTWNGTRYQGQVFASALNAEETAGQMADLVVMSRPNPDVGKGVSGFFWVNNQRRVNGGSTISYSMSAENRNIGCMETYADVVLYDDLSDFANGPAYTNLVPSAGGVFTDTAITVDGVDVPANSVYWQLGNLAPGERVNVTLDVTIANTDTDDPAGPIPFGEVLQNTAHLKSGHQSQTDADTESVIAGVPDDPVCRFNKGATSRVAYGKPINYSLSMSNGGVSACNDILMWDRIPEGATFNSAFLPGGANGQVYYNTVTGATDPNSPPDINVTNGTVGTSWTTTPPADPTTVTWVAFTVPKLVSTYFPEDGVPSSVSASITTTATDLGAESCDTTTVTNTGVARVYAYTKLGGSQPIPPPTGTLTGVATRTTTVFPEVANLLLAGSGTGTRTGTGPISFTATIQNRYPPGQNKPIDDMLDPAMTITLPTGLINGVDTHLPFLSVNAPGGQVDYTGLPNTISVTFPPIAPNGSRSATVTVQAPRGFIDGSTVSFSATASGRDDFCGGVQTASRTSSTTIRVDPYLEVTKQVNLAVADNGSVIDFTLKYLNTGDGVSTETWVIDRVREGFDFVDADVPSGGGAVWFSQAQPPDLPGELDLDFPYSQTLVTSSGLFVQGTVSGGKVTSPFGTNTTYIAVQADNPALSTPLFPTDTLGQITFRAAVADDVPQTAVVGNEAIILSKELLPAISNQTRVLVSAKPSLDTSRSCPDVAAADETFEYVLTYTNNSTNNDDIVRLEEIIPPELEFVSATHVWNDATGGAYDAIDVQPVPSCTTNCDPTESISYVWSVTDAIGGPLRPLEGATLTVTLRVKNGVTSGTFTPIGGSAFAANAAQPEGQGFFSSCILLVENADLWMRKFVDQPAPLSGETVTYTLILQNVGAHHADAVAVIDELPGDMTYVVGSTFVTTPGWSFQPNADPVVNGDGHLEWSIARDNALTMSGQAPGFVPGNSGDITITFRATVNASVGAATTLTNTALVTTITGQDDNVEHTASVDVRTPLPDPYLEKRAPTLGQPGEKITYTLLYGNFSRQRADDVYVIDSLFDDPIPAPDGAADVQFVGATGSNGEVFYFAESDLTQAPPAFDPDDPAAGGWVTSASALNEVTHVAVLLGDIPGQTFNREVFIEVELRTPATGFTPQPGATITNCAAIDLVGGATLDDDTDNNASCADTQTPGIDVSVTTSCDPTGASPGVRPGETVDLTLTLTNTGTVDAYGFRMTDDLASWFEFVGDDATSVVVIDGNGVEAAPIDGTGAPVSLSVPWTKVGADYLLGSDDTASPVHYRRVGLSPGHSVTIVMTVRVADFVGDNTEVDHTVVGVTDYREDWTPGDPQEEILANNDASCGTVVYRPDPIVVKRATASADGGPGPVGAGEAITYEIEYGNTGSTSSADVIISDFLPEGVDFILGSLTGLPEGTHVEYDRGDGSFSYQPTGATGDSDPQVSGLRVVWDTEMSAPTGNIFSQSTALDFVGTFNGTGIIADEDAVGATASGAPTFTSPVIPGPDEGTIVSWGRLLVELRNTSANDTIVFTVLDAATGQPLPGLDGVSPDESGAIDLTDLSPTETPRIQLVATWGTGGAAASAGPSLPQGVEPPVGEGGFCGDSEPFVKHLPTLNPLDFDAFGFAQCVGNGGLIYGFADDPTGNRRTSVWKPASDRYEQLWLSDRRSSDSSFGGVSHNGIVMSYENYDYGGGVSVWFPDDSAPRGHRLVRPFGTDETYTSSRTISSDGFFQSDYESQQIATTNDTVSYVAHGLDFNSYGTRHEFDDNGSVLVRCDNGGAQYAGTCLFEFDGSGYAQTLDILDTENSYLTLNGWVIVNRPAIDDGGEDGAELYVKQPDGSYAATPILSAEGQPVFAYRLLSQRNNGCARHPGEELFHARTGSGTTEVLLVAPENPERLERTILPGAGGVWDANSGEIYVGEVDTNPTVWVPGAGGFERVTLPLPSGWTQGRAEWVTDNGTVLGRRLGGDGVYWTAWREVAGSWIVVPLALVDSTTNSEVLHTRGDTVVGYSRLTGNNRAVVWEAADSASPIPANYLPVGSSEAGRVVGGTESFFFGSSFDSGRNPTPTCWKPDGNYDSGYGPHAMPLPEGYEYAAPMVRMPSGIIVGMALENIEQQAEAPSFGVRGGSFGTVISWVPTGDDACGFTAHVVSVVEGDEPPPLELGVTMGGGSANEQLAKLDEKNGLVFVRYFGENLRVYAPEPSEPSGYRPLFTDEIAGSVQAWLEPRYAADQYHAGSAVMAQMFDGSWGAWVPTGNTPNYQFTTILSAQQGGQLLDSNNHGVIIGTGAGFDGLNAWVQDAANPLTWTQVGLYDGAIASNGYYGVNDTGLIFAEQARECEYDEGKYYDICTELTIKLWQQDAPGSQAFAESEVVYDDGYQYYDAGTLNNVRWRLFYEHQLVIETFNSYGEGHNQYELQWILPDGAGGHRMNAIQNDYDGYDPDVVEVVLGDDDDIVVSFSGGYNTPTVHFAQDNGTVSSSSLPTPPNVSYFYANGSWQVEPHGENSFVLRMNTYDDSYNNSYELAWLYTLNEAQTNFDYVLMLDENHADCYVNDWGFPIDEGRLWGLGAEQQDLYIATSRAQCEVPRIWGCFEVSQEARLDAWSVIYQTDRNPSFSFQVEVEDSCRTSVTNTATVATTSPEITSQNNSSSATIGIATADIAVDIDVDKGTAAFGETLTYTVTVTNHGPNTAEGASIAVVLPADVTGNDLSQSLGDMPAGTSQEFTLTGTVDTMDSGQPLVANASVTTTAIDCDTANNTSSATTTTGTFPNVWVDKVGPSTGRIGQPLVYELHYGNNGNAGANGVSLVDVVPDGMAFVSASMTPTSTANGNPVWDIGSLARDDEQVITVTLRADDCADAGQVVQNTAEITASIDTNGGDNQSSATTQLLEPADALSVAIVPNRLTAEDGDLVTYTIFYRNDGTDASAATTIASVVPAGTTLAAASVSTGGTVDGNGAIVWDVGPLDAGQQGSLKFSVRAGSSGTFQTIARIQRSDQDLCASMAVSEVTTVRTPGLHVVKSASETVACGGDDIDWTVTVTNTGTQPLEGVVVTDGLSSGLTYVGGSIAGPGASDTAVPVLLWNLGTVPAGAGISLTYATRAPSSAGTLVTNSAEVEVGGVVMATSAPTPIRVHCDGSMRLAKAWDGGCAQAGDAVEVTLTYRNESAVEAGAVVVRDFVPNDVFTSVDVLDGGTYDGSSGDITWTVGDVAPGAGGTVRFRATVGDAALGGLMLNVASLASSNLAPTVSNQVSGVVLACDDGDPCTVDSCTPTGGCMNVLAPIDGAVDTSCDGVDDDCDGVVDDDYVRVGEVSCGMGFCASTGLTTCFEGDVFDNCEPGEPLSDSDTMCDLVDEDCDGEVDEDFDEVATSCGIGGCQRDGALNCVDGEVIDTCVEGQPEPETCDTVDNDCDGFTDADDFTLVVTPCEKQDGVCMGSMHRREQCVDGEWEECGDSVYAQHAFPDYAVDDVSCDNIDNDCMNGVDDGVDDVPTTCGLGECNNTGVLSCVDGMPTDSCDPFAGAVPETCNGLDDNCDGAVDEDWPVAGAGCDGDDADLCENGIWTCNAAGDGLECVEDGTAGVEICDNVDNDCDGEIDEGCDDDGDDFCDTAMACLAGPNFVVDVCPNGCGDCNDDEQTVNPAATEICDGLDNNCVDGVDEGCDDDGDDWCDADMQCVDVGDAGTCPNGCGDCDDEVAAVNPGAAEVCDGIDNNCVDGIDEGFDVGLSCQVGLGACEVTGVLVCDSSQTDTVCDAVVA